MYQEKYDQILEILKEKYEKQSLFIFLNQQLTIIIKDLGNHYSQYVAIFIISQGLSWKLEGKFSIKCFLLVVK